MFAAVSRNSDPSCCSLLRAIAAYCSLLQPIAACCSLLRAIAACCSPLRAIAACCSLLQPVATYCELLQPVAAHCELLQPVAAYCMLLQPLRPVSSYCSLLRPIASYCAGAGAAGLRPRTVGHVPRGLLRPWPVAARCGHCSTTYPPAIPPDRPSAPRPPLTSPGTSTAAPAPPAWGCRRPPPPGTRTPAPPAPPAPPLPSRRHVPRTSRSESVSSFGLSLWAPSVPTCALPRIENIGPRLQHRPLPPCHHTVTSRGM